MFIQVNDPNTVEPISRPTTDQPSNDNSFEQTKVNIKRLNNGDIFIGKEHPHDKQKSLCLKISFNGEKYEGQCVEKLYHGIGKLSNQEGGDEEYYGQFKNGKRSGLGYWNDNQNGLKYLGFFYNDIRSGYGSLTTNNGNRLIQGQFINGVAMNFGILSDKSEKYSYKGNLKNGKLEGYGEEEDQGGKYQGMFKNGIRNGIGIYQDNSSTIKYIGGWINDDRYGFGEEIYKRSGDIYRGQFVNNVKHGRGWYYHKNQGLTYTGLFEFGVRSGFGRLDGKSFLYAGGWSNGIMHGLGYMKQNERSYFGFWNKGKRHGLGYELNSGYSYKGFWKNDQSSGYGVMKVFNKSNSSCKVIDGFTYYPTRSGRSSSIGKNVAKKNLINHFPDSKKEGRRISSLDKNRFSMVDIDDDEISQVIYYEKGRAVEVHEDLDYIQNIIDKLDDLDFEKYVNIVSIKIKTVNDYVKDSLKFTYKEVDIAKESFTEQENELMNKLMEIDNKYEDLKNSVNSIVEDVTNMFLNDGICLNKVLQDLKNDELLEYLKNKKIRKRNESGVKQNYDKYNSLISENEEQEGLQKIGEVISEVTGDNYGSDVELQCTPRFNIRKDDNINSEEKLKPKAKNFPNAMSSYSTMKTKPSTVENQPFIIEDNHQHSKESELVVEPDIEKTPLNSKVFENVIDQMMNNDPSEKFSQEKLLFGGNEPSIIDPDTQDLNSPTKNPLEIEIYQIQKEVDWSNLQDNIVQSYLSQKSLKSLKSNQADNQQHYIDRLNDKIILVDIILETNKLPSGDNTEFRNMLPDLEIKQKNPCRILKKPLTELVTKDSIKKMEQYPQNFDIIKPLPAQEESIVFETKNNEQINQTLQLAMTPKDNDSVNPDISNIGLMSLQQSMISQIDKTSNEEESFINLASQTEEDSPNDKYKKSHTINQSPIADKDPQYSCNNQNSEFDNFKPQVRRPSIQNSGRRNSSGRKSVLQNEPMVESKALDFDTCKEDLTKPCQIIEEVDCSLDFTEDLTLTCSINKSLSRSNYVKNTENEMSPTNPSINCSSQQSPVIKFDDIARMSFSIKPYGFNDPGKSDLLKEQPSKPIPTIEQDIFPQKFVTPMKLSQLDLPNNDSSMLQFPLSSSIKVQAAPINKSKTQLQVEIPQRQSIKPQEENKQTFEANSVPLSQQYIPENIETKKKSPDKYDIKSASNLKHIRSSKRGSTLRHSNITVQSLSPGFGRQSKGTEEIEKVKSDLFKAINQVAALSFFKAVTPGESHKPKKVAMSKEVIRKLFNIQTPAKSGFNKPDPIYRLPIDEISSPEDIQDQAEKAKKDQQDHHFAKQKEFKTFDHKKVKEEQNVYGTNTLIEKQMNNKWNVSNKAIPNPLVDDVLKNTIGISTKDIANKILQKSKEEPKKVVTEFNSETVKNSLGLSNDFVKNIRSAFIKKATDGSVRKNSVVIGESFRKIKEGSDRKVGDVLSKSDTPNDLAKSKLFTSLQK